MKRPARPHFTFAHLLCIAWLVKPSEARSNSAVPTSVKQQARVPVFGDSIVEPSEIGIVVNFY